jgi:hypothetical protein
MAAYFWVGGTGTWNTSTTTNWASSSGGAGGAGVPGILDRAFIDTNSGTGTITCTSAICIELTVTATQAIILGAAFSTLTIGGATTFPSGGSFSASANTWTLTVGAISFPLTLTTNGKSLSNLRIASNSTGCALGSDLTLTGSLTLNGGSFTTNNYAVNCGGAFSYIDSGYASSLVLGSSTFTALGFSTSDTTNLSVSAGTSTIVLNGTFSGFSAGSGQTFYNVTFINASAGAPNSLNGTGYTISNNLTVSGPPITQALNTFNFGTASAVITIGNFISARTGPTQRVRFNGTLGSRQTLNIAAASISDFDFSDIIIAGAAAPISGTRLGDCKNNSGIIFPAAKTVYWVVGGTSAWSINGWATSSGGPGDSLNFPLAQDTAVFDNTFFGATVTINFNWSVGTIDASSRVNTLQFSNTSRNLQVYGDIIFGSGVTMSTMPYIVGRITQTITMNGRSFGEGLTIDSPGGTVVFADTFTITGVVTKLTLITGTINANNQNVTITGFQTTGSSSNKTLNMGSGTWTLTGLGTSWNVSSLITTINPSTSTIVLANASSSTFNGGGYTYNNIDVNTPLATFNGTNTFNTLSSSRTTAYTITFGANQTFANWTANGTVGNVVTINSDINGIRRTITKTGGGTITVNYYNIRDSGAQPASTWYAPGSVNSGNNTGWFFFNAYTDTVTENVTYADSPLGGYRYNNAVIENIVSGDSPTVAAAFKASRIEAISSIVDALSAGVTFPRSVSEGLTANDLTDAGFVYYLGVLENITLADIEAAVKIHNATAVEPVNVADVAQCFGFGTIDNTQDVVWVPIDNRQ